MSQLNFLPNGKQVPTEMSDFYEMEVSVWKGVLFICVPHYIVFKMSGKNTTKIKRVSQLHVDALYVTGNSTCKGGRDAVSQTGSLFS